MHQAEDDVRASTGDHAVDEALNLLDHLDSLAVRDHVGVYDSIHSVLQDRLANAEA